MFAVIFVVEPRGDRWNDYLGLAKALKPKLEAIEGFIDIDRFASRRSQSRLLSLSTWRDEKAVVRWRTEAQHHSAQERGRGGIFADYQLRVGEIVNDSAPPQGLKVEETRCDDTAAGAKAATITELVPDGTSPAVGPETLASQLGLGPDREGATDVELFESIYHPGKLLLLGLWPDLTAARGFSPSRPEGGASMRHRCVRIIRAYGMFDRREAPQFYPDVRPSGEAAAE
jgi:heme-degrading monooxygenase HmoA